MTTKTTASTNTRQQQYTTLSEGEHSTQMEVKKSRFLAFAWPVTSTEDALERIHSRRDLSASHNCFALKCGVDQYKSSDDGEPGGTAGRPILSAIEAEGLDYVAVLVVRYFGGVKLGTGGLARAYGGAAREVLRTAPRYTLLPKVLLVATVPFDDLGIAYQSAESYEALRMTEEYPDDNDGGHVVLTLQVEEQLAERLVEALKNESNGRIRVEIKE